MPTVLVRIPVGVLADGTPYFAPLGEVLAEGREVLAVIKASDVIVATP